MARTCMTSATHAVIGVECIAGQRYPLSTGILYWHDNEFEAWAESRRVNEAGGSSRVVNAPGGELSAEDECALSALIAAALGE